MNTNRTIIWTVCSVLLIAAGCSPVNPPGQQEPDYERWQSDVRTALSGIEEYLDEHDGESAAIVLDIDNTALETEYNPGEANPPVLEAAEHAERLDMAVLIVTARLTSDEDKSLNQLRDAGYSPDGICLRELGDMKAEAKQRCRKNFTEDGYTITANVGNRATDFEGGYYDRAFRLPHYDRKLS